MFIKIVLTLADIIQVKVA